MFEKSVRGALAIAAALLAGCGSVSGGDPAFWQPAQGIAGAQVQFVPAPGGAGTPMPPPTGTNPFPPPGGGGVPNYGGNAPFGGSPNGGIPNFGGFPDTGGASPFGGFPPSTGGDPNVGGFPNTGGAFGTGGDPNQPPPPPPPPLTGKCNFTFDVTTKSYGGRFRPRNVGAIYITTASNGFVKSLNVWGGTRLGNLTDWQTLSSGNRTDAVTSATRASAGPISGHWDCTNTSGAVVPGGQYKVCCSFQEDDALPFFGPAPKQACVPFDLPPTASSIDAPDQQYFTGMHISIQ